MNRGGWRISLVGLVALGACQPVGPAAPDQFNANPIQDVHSLVDLAVHVISVNDLLQSLTFLLMYFLLLWAVLRWDTQRRVARWSGRWRTDAGSDLSLTGQTVTWLDDLLRPIRAARERADALAARAAAAGDVAEQRSAA